MRLEFTHPATPCSLRDERQFHREHYEAMCVLSFKNTRLCEHTYCPVDLCWFWGRPVKQGKLHTSLSLRGLDLLYVECEWGRGTSWVRCLVDLRPDSGFRETRLGGLEAPLLCLIA